MLNHLRDLLTEIAGISLPARSVCGGAPSRSGLLKAELIKEAVVSFKLLQANTELLSGQDVIIYWAAWLFSGPFAVFARGCTCHRPFLLTCKVRKLGGFELSE